MAVKTKDEIIAQIKTYLGDNTGDDALAILEDLSDTLDALGKDGAEDLRKQLDELGVKMREQDEAWRKRYADRFSGKIEEKEEIKDMGGDQDNEIRTEEIELTDLFKTKKED